MGSKTKINIIASSRTLFFRAQRSLIIVAVFCFAFSLPAAASYLPFNTSVNMNVGVGTSTPQGAFVVTNGNVGIGTWVPAGQLDVEGTLAKSIFMGNVGIGTSAPGQELEVGGLVPLASNGNALDISRTTASTRDDLQLYITSSRDAFIFATIGGKLQIGWKNTIDLESGWNNSTGLLTLGDQFAGSGTSWQFRHYAYLPTPATSEYVQWTLNPTTTNYELTRQDTNIGGLNVQMPATFTGGNVGIGTSSPFGGILIVKGAGNVGIGSLTPGQMLDVQGTVRTTGLTMSGQSPTIGYVLTAADSTGDTTWSSTGVIGGWSVSGANVYETSSGNVGIGTTTPQSSLVVTNGNVGIGTWTAAGGSLIVATGNVGIGSATPGQKLDVQGTLRVGTASIFGDLNANLIIGEEASLTNSLGNSIVIGVSTSATGGANTVLGSFASAGGEYSTALGFEASAPNESEINLSDGVTELDIYNGTANFQRNSIVTTGNIGIGSISPAGILDVEGTVRPIVLNGKNNINDNVGIGSFAPGQALDVNGTARMTGFTLNLNPNAGYVLVGNSVGVGTWMAASTLGGSSGSGTVSSGTIDQMAYYTGTGTTVGSLPVLTTDLTNIGIGTSGPSSLLDVNRKFNILASGNVGIGSLVPGQKLDVQGTVRAIGELINGNVGIGTSFVNGTGEAALTIMNGNVGIGTWVPGQLLDVAGYVRASARMLITNVTTSADGLYMDDGAGSTILTITRNAANNEYLNSNAGNLSLQAGSGNYIRLDTGGGAGDVMEILPSGNVGISSTNPGQILDVQGTARMTGFTLNLNPNAGYVLVGNSVGVGTWMAASSLGSGAGTVTSGTIDQMAYYTGTGTTVGSLPVLTTDLTNIGIGTSGPSSLLDVNRKFNVLASGNVGIGSLVPGQKLDVQGTVRDIGEIVNGNVGIGTSFVNGAGEGALTVMNGYVGIGTWAPQYSLSINGNLGIGTFSVTGLGEVALASVNVPFGASSQAFGVANEGSYYTGVIYGDGSYAIGPGTSARDTYLWRPTTSTFQIDSNKSGGIANLVVTGNVGIGTYNPFGGNLIVKGGGNVGIGSLTPGQILDVQGTARMTGFTLNLNPNAGYVLVGNSVGVGTWMAVSSLGSGAGTVSSGTIDQMAYYTATGTTVGSLPVLTTDLTNIGIGTSGPSSLLDVNRKFNVLASGNVGIGSLVPGQALDIQGTVRTSLGAIFNGNVGIGTASTAAAALTVMRGNVGIGTWIPAATLDVEGTFQQTIFAGNVGVGTWTTTGNTAVLTLNNAARGNTDLIDFYKSNQPGSPISFIDNSGGPHFIEYATSQNGDLSFPDFVDSTYHDGMYFPAALTLGFVTNNLERMRIDSNGNVGVGSSNPGQILDVNGTARMTGFTLNLNPNAGYVLVGNSVGVGTWMAASSLGSGAGTVSTGTIDQIAYYTGNGTIVGSLPVLTTDLTNIGIGTSGPSSLLDVNRKFNVLASGNVGIGTWIPHGQLDVEGTLSTAFFAGNIGIGTTNPIYPLVITSNGATNDNILQLLSKDNGNDGIVFQSYYPSLNFNSYYDGANQRAIGNDWTGALTFDPTDGNIEFDTGGALGNPGNGQVIPGFGGVFFVETDGQTGIGKVFPINNYLDVAGSVSIGAGYANGSDTELFTAPPNGMLVQGNVGLGSTAPGQKLDIQGTARMTGFTLNLNPNAGYVLVGNSVGVGTWMAVSSLGSGTGTVNTGTVNQMAYYTGTGTTVGSLPVLTTDLTNIGIGTSGPSSLLDVNRKFNVLASGNVGIGSLVPGQALDIQGTVRTSLGAIFNGNVGIGSATPGQKLDVQGTVRNIGEIVNGNVGIGTSFVNGVGEAALTVMNGNVGIGTWLPHAQLDVEGSLSTASFAGNVGIGSANPGTALDVQGNLRVSNGAAYNEFTTNVGINSANPGAALDVNGMARMIGFTLNLNPNAGYVLVGNSVGVGTWMPVGSLGSGAVSTGTINQLAYYTANGTAIGSLPVLTTDTTNIGIGTSGPSSLLDVNRKFNVLASGNVGVGSLVPGQALDIQGTIRTSLGAIFNGNVGISSSAPGQKLDVQGTVRAIGEIVNGNVGIGTSFINGVGEAALTVMNGNVGIGTWVPNDLLEVQGTLNSFYIQNSGNVGIGSNAPQGVIDYEKGTSAFIVSPEGLYQQSGTANWSFSAPANINLDDNFAGGVGMIVENDSSSSSAYAQLTLSSDTGHLYLAVNSSTSSGSGGPDGVVINNPNNDILAFQTQFIDRLSVTGNGNIGIGSDYPGQILDVNGMARMTGFTLTGNGAAPGSIMITNAVGVGTWMAINTISSAGGITSETPNEIAYYSGVQTLAGNSNMVLNSNNVGLGTVTPLATLQVVGNIGIGTVKNGDRFITTSPPDGGMIVEGNVGIGTSATASLLQLGPGIPSRPPISLGVGTYGTNTGTAGAIEFDGTAFYATSVASSRQVIPAQQFVILESAFTVVNNNTAPQKLFDTATSANGTITLQSNTSYLYSCSFSLSGLSTTSSSFGFTFAGTTITNGSTFTFISYGAKVAALTTATNAQVDGGTAGDTTLVSNSTGPDGVAFITGQISVPAGDGGTLIPEVDVTRTPTGGNFVVAVGSYFNIYPIGSAAVTTQGDWS